MKRFLKWLIAFFTPPPGWTYMAIWAPPIVIPAASPIWRDSMAANDELGVPVPAAADATATDATPAQPASPAARRRAHLRLVTPLGDPT